MSCFDKIDRLKVYLSTESSLKRPSLSILCYALRCSYENCVMWRSWQNNFNLTTWLIAPFISQSTLIAFVLFFPSFIHSLYVSLHKWISISRHRLGQVCSHQRGPSGGRRGFHNRCLPEVSVFHKTYAIREWNVQFPCFYLFFLLFIFICLTISFGKPNRKSIELRGIDRSSKDDKYFRIREVNSSRIQILLKESLNELVDSDSPHNILKFKIQCNGQGNRRNNHDVRLWKFSFFSFFLSVLFI